MNLFKWLKGRGAILHILAGLKRGNHSKAVHRQEMTVISREATTGSCTEWAVCPGSPGGTWFCQPRQLLLGYFHIARLLIAQPHQC